MVLESLFNPFSVKKKPWEMYFAGLMFSGIGFFVSYLVFRDIAGILAVFLTAIAALPIFYTTIKNEEELDLKLEDEWSLLKEHTKVVIFFILFFLGVLTTFTATYLALPGDSVSDVFIFQENAIKDIQVSVSDSNRITGGASGSLYFKGIFFNNIKVLFFCIIFSFLYGTGAIFVLTWNASVVAVAIGNLFKSKIAISAAAVGLPSIAGYFSVASFSVLRYMLHGILEMAAYMVAGLAGSIVSIALIKHNLKEHKVLVDALDLLLISIGLLVVAGIVEVYISPILI
tara:strand:+ start:46112 stop:46969 length:858 start_codon:yes stop_codon:yes gene_type:complete